MTAPQKPWEGAGGNVYCSDLSLSNAASLPTLPPQPSFLHPAPGASTEPPSAPALPPRPQIGSQMMTPSYGFNSGGYNSYGNMGAMGSYGMGGMGGLGGYGGGYGYSGYGGNLMGGMGAPYGGGYNRFGPMDLESRFIQMAEESSRPAFQSIEGVVHAVGSVAAMLDNTYLAMTSSFRAILGVAENFGRLRSVFAQVWATLAVARSLNWLLRKLLVILGIRTETEFKAWAQAVAESQSGAAPPEQRQRGAAWPVLMFFGVVAAAPYLLYRLMRGAATSGERLSEPATWERPLRAVAAHDFAAASPQEAGFRAGQILHVAPQHLQGSLWNSGWLMGSVDRQSAGLVPTTHIKIIRPAEPTAPKPPLPAAPQPLSPVADEALPAMDPREEL